MQQRIFRVLFLCTGNSCRSPMAEGILKKLLNERNIQNIVVESAGTMSLSGMYPTSYAVVATVERGIDISQHRSRSLTKEMVEEADIILVMENAHKRFVEELSPFANGKVFLLKEYGGGSKEDIDDPIGMDLDFYRMCYEELEREIKRIFPIILKSAGKNKEE